MPRVNNLDELNILSFEDYFGQMGISDKEKRRRIELAEDWDDIIFYIFALFEIEDEIQATGKNFITNQMKKEIIEKIGSKYEFDDYVNEYINEVASQIVDSTYRNYEDPYYLSKERATFIAEDQAQAMGNYFEYREKKDTYTYKTWMTMEDERVRHNHQEVDRTMLPIDEPFTVGSYLAQFPRDTQYGLPAQEVINCRCWVEYS